MTGPDATPGCKAKIKHDLVTYSTSNARVGCVRDGLHLVFCEVVDGALFSSLVRDRKDPADLLKLFKIWIQDNVDLKAVRVIDTRQ